MPRGAAGGQRGGVRAFDRTQRRAGQRRRMTASRRASHQAGTTIRNARMSAGEPAAEALTLPGRGPVARRLATGMLLLVEAEVEADAGQESVRDDLRGAVPSSGIAPQASISACNTGRPSRICCLTVSVRSGGVARLGRAIRAVCVSSSTTSRNIMSKRSSMTAWLRAMPQKKHAAAATPVPAMACTNRARRRGERAASHRPRQPAGRLEAALPSHKARSSASRATKPRRIVLRPASTCPSPGYP